MELAYHVVDVFTQVPLEGNPLAVFPDARGLDTVTMQRIARELNLSETTFVLPAHGPGAVARVRIFTPASEMRFAGHPTIGTAYVLRSTGRVPADATAFVFEERVGPVAVRVDRGDDPMIWLATPPISKGRTYDGAACARVLGLEPGDLLANVPCRILSAGNPNLYALSSAGASTARRWMGRRCRRWSRINRRLSVCSRSHRRRTARTRACSRRRSASPKIRQREARRARSRRS